MIIRTTAIISQWRFSDVLPEPVTTFLAYLGNLTTPLSMFIIRIIVYGVGISKMTLDKDSFGILVGRYLISPLLVWITGQFISIPPMMLAVFIIQSAMPVQNSIPILARFYGADQKFAASALGRPVSAACWRDKGRYTFYL